MLRGVGELTPDGGIVEPRHVPDPDRHAMHQERNERARDGSPNRSSHRRAHYSPCPQPPRWRKTPESRHHRPAGDQKRSRDHHDQLVLRHVGGKECGAERMQRRDEAESEHHPASAERCGQGWESSRPSPCPRAHSHSPEDHRCSRYRQQCHHSGLERPCCPQIVWDRRHPFVCDGRSGRNPDQRRQRGSRDSSVSHVSQHGLKMKAGIHWVRIITRKNAAAPSPSVAISRLRCTAPGASSGQSDPERLHVIRAAAPPSAATTSAATEARCTGTIPLPWHAAWTSEKPNSRLSSQAIGGAKSPNHWSAMLGPLS
jgi:hypothetical protein